MNEYIEVQFRKGGKRFDIRRQLPDGSIELAEPDPTARRVAIGFSANDDLTTYRMRRVRELRGWGPNEFRLKVSVEGGTLVLRGDDPDALPEGRYRLRINLEEAKTRPRKAVAEIDEHGFAEFPMDIETDDRDVAVDLTACDADVQRVLDASTIGGMGALPWLQSPDIRPGRKACLLNLVASLRVRPSVTSALLRHVRMFYVASRDRAYAAADAALLTDLEGLAAHPKKPFYREGRPTAEIHKLLVTSIPPVEQPLFSAQRLVSFRGEGSPSLQIVVAEPPPGHTTAYAEFDLDLGNALQDVVGFVVHMGELLDGKPTNHLELHRKLAAKKAKS
ncbi:MAG TPA: hypothetical protein VES67_07235 [Vicinamibacterales bacterium]|nr:hypothetical protein [Vicinamibacterales bacterium]